MAIEQDLIDKIDQLVDAMGSKYYSFGDDRKYQNRSASELTDLFNKENRHLFFNSQLEDENAKLSRKEKNKLAEEYNNELEEEINRLKEIERDETRTNDERIRAHEDIIKYQEQIYRNEKRLNSERDRGLDILKNIGQVIGKFHTPYAQAEAAASKYTKALGGTKAAMDALRKSSINNVVKAKIGIEYNVSTDELINLQQNYIKGVGRNIKLGNADQENIAAMHAVYQGGETELAALFEKFGVGIDGTSKHLSKMFTDASKSGVSLEKYADNVKKGLAMAQTYTFTGGLRSMERMAQRAAAIRMDMAQVQSMASSLDNVEKSITTAAKLQVLGGSFAAAADPMGMLRESLMDPEALQKRMENITANMGTFNRSTGEVDITAFNMQRLKAYAEATGQDFGQVVEQTRRQAQRGEIRSQLGSSANAAGLSDDMKALIENTATFQNGKAGVSINGNFKTIDELTNNDYEELIKETQDEKADIKDIAKNLRSLVDKREGARKQKDAVQAQISTPFAKMEGTLHDFFGKFNLFLGMWTVYTLGSSLVHAFGGRGTFANGGGIRKIASKFTKSGTMGASSRIGPTAAKTATTAVGGVSSKQAAQYYGKRALVKTFGKEGAKKILGMGATTAASGAKGIGSLIKGMGPGGILGIAGAAGNILTDSMVAKGKVKEGGSGHAAMKIASQAATGAGIGATIGSIIPGLGTAIGGVIGGAIGTSVGAFQIQKIRRRQIVDNQLSELGIERKGKYTKDQLEELDTALQKGKMSNKLRRKLLRQGDTEIVNQINAVKDEKKAAKEAKRDKRHEKFMDILGAGKQKFGTANIEVGTAHISTGLVRGKKENGRGNGVETVKQKKGVSTKTANGGASDINVNINGTLKLEGGNGQSVDILAEIKKNPMLLSQLTDMIVKKMNTDQYGGYRSDRTLGTNRPS